MSPGAPAAKLVDCPGETGRIKMATAKRPRPQRSCIGCRAVRDKQDLIRLVHTPDGRYLADAGGKLPGRGAYLCPTPACLAIAIKRRRFDRAFRTTVPPEAAHALEAALQQYTAEKA